MEDCKEMQSLSVCQGPQQSWDSTPSVSGAQMDLCSRSGAGSPPPLSHPEAAEDLCRLWQKSSEKLSWHHHMGKNSLWWIRLGCLKLPSQQQAESLLLVPWAGHCWLLPHPPPSCQDLLSRLPSCSWARVHPGQVEGQLFPWHAGDRHGARSLEWVWPSPVL